VYAVRPAKTPKRSQAECEAIAQKLAAEFDMLWAVWRRNDAKARAKLYFVRLRTAKKPLPFPELLAAAKYDVAKWTREGREPHYDPYLSTWLNENPLDGDRPKPKAIKYAEYGYRPYPGGPSPDLWYEQHARFATEEWKREHPKRVELL
jgi:hypothetical protein